MSGYFITSTDTNAGKTTVSICLMKHFKSLGNTVACMKPVSAGCVTTPAGLRNDDALQLMRESSIDIAYERLNPFAFEPPVAPHIAAQQSHTVIDLQTIKDSYSQIANSADIVIVEGAGGWLVPINESQTMEDVAAGLSLPVILVVGMRLGCLNHALLTANRILDKKLSLAGWIANHVEEDMLQQPENIETLKKRIQAPYLGSVAYNSNLKNFRITFSDAGKSVFKG